MMSISFMHITQLSLHEFGVLLKVFACECLPEKEEGTQQQIWAHGSMRNVEWESDAALFSSWSTLENCIAWTACVGG